MESYKATTTKAEVDVQNSELTANFPVHKSITVFHRSERLCVIKIKKVNPQPSSPQHVWFTQYYSVNHLTEWDAALNFLWIQYIYIDRDDQTDRISLSQESSTQIKNKMSAAASSAVASSLYPYCITSGEPYPPKKTGTKCHSQINREFMLMLMRQTGPFTNVAN